MGDLGAFKDDFMLALIANDCKASQDGFELFHLLRLARDFRVRTVLEIGVDTGWLMAAWRDTLEADVIGIDISTERFDDATGMRDNLIVADSGKESTKTLVQERLAGRKIDLLFVDGDHSFDATMRDIGLYQDLVESPCGLICIHDISRVGHLAVPGVETREAFDAMRKIYKSIEISNGPVGIGGPGIGVLFA